MQTSRSRQRLLDAGHQNRLAARLRTASEPRALAAIRRLIAQDPKVGLSIANRILRKPAHLEAIFKEGLHTANESTARFWIEALGPRIGAAKVIELVREQAKSDPEIVARAVYWLPSLVKGNPKATAELNRLRQDFAQPRSA